MSVNETADTYICDYDQEDESKLKTAMLRILSSRLSRVILAVAAVVALTIFLPLWASVMLMVILYIHEYGHLWAMKKAGVETNGVYAIPLLGAVTIGKVQYVSPSANVLISLAGPATGVPLAILAVPVAVLTQNRFIVAFAAFTLLINLFNLLPFFPLDGGKVVHFVLAGKDVAKVIIAVLSLIVGIGAVIAYPSIITAFLAVFGVIYTAVSISELRNNRRYGEGDYAMDRPMNFGHAVWSMTAYLMLILSMLALGFWLIAESYLNTMLR